MTLDTIGHYQGGLNTGETERETFDLATKRLQMSLLTQGLLAWVRTYCMTDTERKAQHLDKLLAWARIYRMTDAEREEQRRSFAFGNVRFHNPALTRAQVDDAADAMKRTREIAARALPSE
jgi:hypothetical protein